MHGLMGPLAFIGAVLDFCLQLYLLAVLPSAMLPCCRRRSYENLSDTIPRTLGATGELKLTMALSGNQLGNLSKPLYVSEVRRALEDDFGIPGHSVTLVANETNQILPDHFLVTVDELLLLQRTREKIDFLENPATLQNMPESIRDDFECVMAAVAHDGCQLQHATPERRGDKAIVLAAIESYRSAIKYASAELLDDVEVILHALQHGDGHVEKNVEKAASKRAWSHPVIKGFRREQFIVQMLYSVVWSLIMPIVVLGPMAMWSLLCKAFEPPIACIIWLLTVALLARRLVCVLHNIGSNCINVESELRPIQFLNKMLFRRWKGRAASVGNVFDEATRKPSFQWSSTCC